MFLSVTTENYILRIQKYTKLRKERRQREELWKMKPSIKENVREAMEIFMINKCTIKRGNIQEGMKGNKKWLR